MSNDTRRESEEDFGLPVGATFEPSGDREEPFDLAKPHVMTVLGPVTPAALGVTLVHERLIQRPPLAAHGDQDNILDDPHATLAEVEDFHAAGGGAVVDSSRGAEGRDIQALLWIAARAPAHIIASTGLQLQAENHPSPSTQELSSFLSGEICQGIDGTTARAGVIQFTVPEQAANNPGVAVAQATAEAQQATGALIAVDGSGAVQTRQAVSMLRALDVDPGRLLITGLDSSLSNDHLKGLLDTGVFVSFADVDNDERLSDRICWCVQHGFAEQLLISPHLTKRSQQRAYGGQPGWVFVLERFTLVLMNTGLDATTIRGLLVDNPRRALTIAKEPPA